MSEHRYWPHLNLRHKIITSLVLFILAIMVLGAISYNDLQTITDKLRILSVSHRLNDQILEARRYEKNYLLYHQPQDMWENQSAVRRALALTDSIAPDLIRLKTKADILGLRRDLNAYGAIMGQVAELSRTDAEVPDNLIHDLRQKGKDMLNLTQDLVVFEQEQIASILETLKAQLLLSVVIVLVLGPLLVFVMFRNMLKVLDRVMEATERIAQGKFERTPVQPTSDEMGQVMGAFNRMVQELETRQEQLVQAKKLSSIGTLAAGIAHQLNNPLNNISTSCQIAIEELGDEAPEFLNKMLHNIEQESMRARDIVKGLLEFSRDRDFSLRPMALGDLVERTFNLVSSQVPPEIKLEQEVPVGLKVQVDAQRMQEVILNLVLNAVDAIDEAVGTITVRAYKDADTAVIEVEDTGSGIPRDIQGQIFDPFYTTKNDATGSGTGLGLSIAYGIVKRHGGTITVDNVPGKGARFSIHLPLVSQKR